MDKDFITGLATHIVNFIKDLYNILKSLVAVLNPAEPEEEEVVDEGDGE